MTDSIFDAVEPASVRTATDDDPHLHVVGVVDPRVCTGDGSVRHVSGVVLADDSKLSDADAIALLKAGRVLYMLPPEGAPAYEASQALGGARLLLQVRTCAHCNERVLFA